MIPILFFLSILVPTYPHTQEKEKDLVTLYVEYLEKGGSNDFGKFIEWVSNDTQER